MVPSFVLAVVLSFSAILVFTHALWLAIDGRRRRLPPGPWTLPVIGSVHAVRWSRSHRSLARLAERHGPLMCIWFGRYPVVVVSTPDAARKVLACSDLAGRTVLDTMRAEGHAGNCVMFLPPGPKWRAIRKLVMAEVMARPSSPRGRSCGRRRRGSWCATSPSARRAARPSTSGTPRS